MLDTLPAVFCVVDDFCNVFEPEWNKIKLKNGTKNRNRPGKLSLSEIMTIQLSFQLSDHRNFKGYYHFLLKYSKLEFPRLISYARFVQIAHQALLPLVAFFEFVKGEKDGLYFIDSTAIAVCKNKRIYRHKVFKNLAKIGKSTMGWFFGFKLHLIINSQGDPVSFKLTQGNTDDRKFAAELSKNLHGKIFGDKGYISKELFQNLFQRNLQLVTALKGNMKRQIMTKEDSNNLSKRNLIESTFNVLKNIQHLEHSRHRSIKNFMTNLVSTICGYALRHLKERCAVTQKLN